MSPFDSEDLYERLGVPRDADAKTIKGAYRRMARKHHPDVNPEDPEAESRFKSVSTAYQILSDAKKRALYDQHGLSAFRPGGPAQSQGIDLSDIESIFSHLGLNDIMEGIFGFGGAGRGRGRTGARRGEDLALRVLIDLESAHGGVTGEQGVRTHLPCAKCGASGVRAGTTPRTCPQCKGSGQVVGQRGFLRLRTPCPSCRGAGRTSDPCPHCHGEGRKPGNDRLSYKIPTGIQSGQRIRFSGRGAAGTRGGPHGDLFLHIQVREHALFHRQGDEIAVELHLTLPELLLGSRHDLEGLGGERVAVKVPAGSNEGDVVRVPGKGVARRQGGRGDLLAILRAAPAGRVGKKAFALLETLGKILPKPKRRFKKP